MFIPYSKNVSLLTKRAKQSHIIRRTIKEKTSVTNMPVDNIALSQGWRLTSLSTAVARCA